MNIQGSEAYGLKLLLQMLPAGTKELKHHAVLLSDHAATVVLKSWKAPADMDPQQRLVSPVPTLFASNPAATSITFAAHPENILPGKLRELKSKGGH